ncbi:hypothetical protein V8C34DRAFT_161940 [Trichoderma compactum]
MPGHGYRPRANFNFNRSEHRHEHRQKHRPKAQVEVGEGLLVCVTAAYMHACMHTVSSSSMDGRKASSEMARIRKVFFLLLSSASANQWLPRLHPAAPPKKHIDHSTWPIPAPGCKNSSAERRVNGSRMRFREAIYARYREMASEMLAQVHHRVFVVWYWVVSNHNRCLDAPAHGASPQAAQWPAPCQVDRSRPGSVGIHCHPTWPLPGGTVRDFPLADNQDKRETGPSARRWILLLPLLLITHHTLSITP